MAMYHAMIYFKWQKNIHFQSTPSHSCY